MDQMTNDQLNEAWAKLTGQPKAEWAEDLNKLDLSFVPQDQKIVVAKKVSSPVAQEFYNGGAAQDAHLFYFMMICVKNRVIMEAILTEVKQ